MTASTHIRCHSSDEDGIGMIEIVVAMFVLALLAVAFLPVLTASLSVTRKNSEVAVATQLVSTQMELARSAAGTCASVIAFATGSTTVVDGRSYDISRTTPATCSAPGAAVVTVSVKRTGTSSVLASAQTRLIVGTT